MCNIHVGYQSTTSAEQTGKIVVNGGKRINVLPWKVFIFGPMIADSERF